MAARSAANFGAYGVFFCLTAFLVAVPPAHGRETYAAFARRMAQPQIDARFRPDLEALLLSETNRYRVQKGVARLSANATNLGAARAHAMDMALHDFVGHVASTGAGFDSRMHALRPNAFFLPQMGENAARVSSKEPVTNAKALKLMSQWIGSPSHRKALGNRTYTTVSIGVVQRGLKLYAVQVFSGPDVTSNVGRTTAKGAGGLY
jgi:uncharacterized protein YkwD